MKNLYSFKATPALLVFPGLFIMLIAIGVPLVLSGYYSLMNWAGFGKMSFIGFGNYQEILQRHRKRQGY